GSPLKAAQAAQAVAAAQAALDQANAALQQSGDQITRNAVKEEFSSIDGVAVTLTGRQLTQVYSHGNDGLLSITPDAPVHTSGVIQWSSSQLWPYVSGAANNWNTDQNAAIASNMPTIAIVDSGVQSRADFGSRLLAS